MAMPAIRRRWTADNVRQLIPADRPWPRYELLDGELLVTPAPGVGHQAAVSDLLILLGVFVEREAIGLALTSPSDVQLRPETIVQPDVFIVPLRDTPRETAADWSDIGSLLLAVEVISPSSARTDRVTKRDFYLAAGVPEYWIIDLDARVVERWTPARQTPALERARFDWSPSPDATLTIDVAAFFDRVSAKARAIGPART